MVDHILDKDQLIYGKFEDTYLRKKYADYLNQAKNERQMHLFFEANPNIIAGH